MVTITLSQQEVEIINKIQKEQLSNPRRSMVNGEGAFVTDKLNRLNYDQLAEYYWSTYCNSYFKITNESVLELISKLQEIDDTVDMPSWG